MGGGTRRLCESLLVNALRALALLLMLLPSGCATREPNAGTVPKTANGEVLDEAGRTGAWFHARRVRPIWAKRHETDETVKTIEGTEAVQAGDYLCRGEAGDIWPQTAKNLGAKYEKAGDADAEGWCKYVPRPDNQGVMAAQVPHAFTIRARWGLLSGKAGDYVIKSFSDREVAYPDDVWLVDQKLFQATYQRVETQP
jgi:hypothetical protein